MILILGMLEKEVFVVKAWIMKMFAILHHGEEMLVTLFTIEVLEKSTNGVTRYL